MSGMKVADIETEIIEMTVSIERTIFKDDGYPKKRIFQSAKAAVPRDAAPKIISEGLRDWLRGEMDKFEAAENGGQSSSGESRAGSSPEAPLKDSGAGGGQGCGTKEPDGATRNEELKDDGKRADESRSKVPVCPTHGKDMRPSKHPKDGARWYCPVRDEKGKYCKETM